MKLFASKSLTAAAVALTVLAALPTSAISGSGVTLRATQQKPLTIQQANPVLRAVNLKFACAVAGTPVEFPDDIKIWESTGWTVPAGTKINWSVSGYNGQTVASGQVTLSAPLQSGKVLFVSHALPGGMEAGTPCASSKA